MGIYHCDVCSAKLMGETFGCDACARAHGDGGILCDECATEATCGDCGGACCHGCGNERFECCGKVLCGAGRDKELYTTAEALRQAYGVSRAACVWKHALLPPWPQLSNDTRMTLVLEPGSEVENTEQLCLWWDTFGYAGGKGTY